jgi:hypothetical protein
MKKILTIIKRILTSYRSSFYYIEEEKAFKREVERNSLNKLLELRKN